jgi:ketosteroid isomerase-like protein
MEVGRMVDGPQGVAERIRRATNDHDLDALADCFTSGYESVWPVHPARSFVGPEQVRRNWDQIFKAVPDVRIEIVDSVVSGEDVWAEWEFAGHRVDGEPFLMRGVTIISARDGRAELARFYLEPVEADAEEVNVAVRRLIGVPVADHGSVADQASGERR